jgi:hypothetical protein
VAAPAVFSGGLASATPPAAPGALVCATLAAVRSNGTGFPTAAALAELLSRSERAARLKVFTAAALPACLAGAVAFLAPGSPVRDVASWPDPVTPTATEEAGGRERCARSLSRLARAMLDFHDAHGRFPPAAVTDGAGPPLLSWRVLLLPHLGESELYGQFRLDEPWDGGHNRRLLARMPAVFSPSRRREHPPGSTVFQVFAGPGTVFDGGVVRLRDVTDGTARTLLIAEASEAAPWTRPVDLPFAADKPLPPLGGLFPEGFHVALADGTVRFLPRGFPEERLRAVITRGGGEVVSLDDPPKVSPPRR